MQQEVVAALAATQRSYAAAPEKAAAQSPPHSKSFATSDFLECGGD